MKKLQTILKIIFVLSVVSFFLSLYYRNTLPSPKKIDSKLLEGPSQNPSTTESFKTNVGDYTYTISPKYDYEIYGLVTALSNKDFRNDPIKSKDVCLVWGENIKNEVYQHLEYKNFARSCIVNSKPNDYSWMDKFSTESLSSNLVMSSDHKLEKIMRNVWPGDQVYIKGYLTPYDVTGPQNYNEHIETSDSKTDELAEIIYVTDFKIIHEQNHLWKYLFNFSIYAAFLCFLSYIIILIVKISQQKTDQADQYFSQSLESESNEQIKKEIEIKIQKRKELQAQGKLPPK